MTNYSVKKNNLNTISINESYQIDADVLCYPHFATNFSTVKSGKIKFVDLAIQSQKKNHTLSLARTNALMVGWAL